MPAGLGLLRRRSAQGLKLLAATFSDGSTSGQFAFINSNSPANNPPYVNKQTVHGISGVLAGPKGSDLMLVDNGFGATQTARRPLGFPIPFQQMQAMPMIQRD